MNADLRKKLEEAAEMVMPEVVRGNPFYMPSYHCGFRKGAEYGYKEAIKVAKEWLKDNGYLATNGWYTIKGTLTDFETDMNKLLEG